MDFLRPLADNNFPADSDNTSGSAVTLGPWPPGASGRVAGTDLTGG